MALGQLAQPHRCRFAFSFVFTLFPQFSRENSFPLLLFTFKQIIRFSFYQFGKKNPRIFKVSPRMSFPDELFNFPRCGAVPPCPLSGATPAYEWIMKGSLLSTGLILLVIFSLFLYLCLCSSVRSVYTVNVSVNSLSMRK